tara:strand:- start:439 stop:1623 length:1185 start_codon:yes stop_codon:yes gene_type:complete
MIDWTAMAMTTDSHVKMLAIDNWGSAESGYKIPDHALGKFEYADLCKLAHRSRDVYGKGKYINTWLKLKLSSNEEPELWINGCRFMTVSKDNIATVHMDTKDVWTHGSTTFVTAVNSWIPFIVERHRTGIYRMAHKLSLYKQLEGYEGDDTYVWYAISKLVRQSQVITIGLRYNLLTGELLNPSKINEPEKCVENADKRKVWRKKITAFKKQLRVRGKLGLIESTINELKNIDGGKFLSMVETHAKLLGTYDGKLKDTLSGLRHNQLSAYQHVNVNWSKPNAIEFLAKHIDTNAMPSEIYIPICIALSSIRSHTDTHYYKPKEDWSSEINKFFGKLSIHLRRHYGVIEKEATVESDDSLYTLNFNSYRYNNIPIDIKQIHNTFKGVLDDNKNIK